MNEHYFDQLTKLAAGNLPRREALRRFGAVVGGALLGSLGLGRSVTVAQTAGNSQGCAVFCSKYRTLGDKKLCLATCRTCPSPTQMCGGTSINSVTCCTSGVCTGGVCGPAGNLCAEVRCDPPRGEGPCQITYSCNPTTGKCDRSGPDDGQLCGPPGFTCQGGFCQRPLCDPIPFPTPGCSDSTPCPHPCGPGICFGGTCYSLLYD